MIEQAKKTKVLTPFRMVVHGGPKVGKSTFAAGAPKPIFICTEDGLGGIDTTSLPLCQSYEDVKSQLQAVLDEEHSYKTLVLDSADWLEKLIFEKVLNDYGVKSVSEAAGGYGRGYDVANYHWGGILRLLKQINISKRMFIVVICHSRTSQYMDPMGDTYDQYRMKLYSPKSGAGASDMLMEWADIIGFCWAETVAKKSDGARSKASIPTGDRVLFMESSGSFVAGNRYALPSRMPMSFGELLSAYKSAIETTQPQQEKQ